MSSDYRRIIWNTRERIITDDFNNATALLHRALIETTLPIAQGGSGFYGVLRGLVVSIPGGDLTVNVSPGIAFIPGTAPTSYDSATEVIELRAVESVDLTALVDGANPRWVVIEISATDGTETSSSRDQFNPSTGTFTSSSVTKVMGSDPTIRAVAGTAAAQPVFPAGASGWIPLAYVYLDAAAADIDAGEMVQCRPVIRPINSFSRRGGGCLVLAIDTDVTVSDFECDLGDGGPVISSSGVEFDIYNTDLWVDGDAPPITATGQAIAVFAMRPPYPAGYSALLAPREFIAGAAGAAHIAGAHAGLQNAVIAVTTTINPLPDSDGRNSGFAVTDPVWAGTETTNALYVGAVTKPAGVDTLIQQRPYGGQVIFYGTATNWITDTVSATSSGTGDWRRSDPLGASGSFLLPDCSSSALVRVSVACDDDTSYSFFLISGAAGGSVNDYRAMSTQISGENVDGGTSVWLYDNDGAFRWSHTTAGAGTCTVTIEIGGYIDAVLAG